MNTVSIVHNQNGQYWTGLKWISTAQLTTLDAHIKKQLSLWFDPVNQARLTV